MFTRTLTRICVRVRVRLRVRVRVRVRAFAFVCFFMMGVQASDEAIAGSDHEGTDEQNATDRN